MSVKAFAVVQSDLPCAKITKAKSVTVTDMKDEKTFGFDAAFNTNELELFYKSHLTGIVHDALSGYNVNITCCGIAGTGSGQLLHGAGFTAQDGVVPMVIRDLFHKTNNTQYLISASMLQIDGGGGLTDILNPHSRKIRVRKSSKLGCVVDNLTAYVVSSADQACRLYSEGHKTESGLKTRHRDVVFTLTVSQKQQDPATSGMLSRITFLDLVGHEAEPENTGVKALLKSMTKGKPRDPECVPHMIIGEAISRSKAIIIGCCAGQETQPSNAMKLFEFVKMSSGMRTSPHKNNADISKPLAQVRKDIKAIRETVMQQSVPDKKSVDRLESLIAELNDLKTTSWDRRIAVSNLCTDERKSNLSDRGLLWVLQSTDSSNQNDIKALQERISEMSSKVKEQKQSAEKIKEDLRKELDSYTASVSSGKSDDQTKARVGRIQSMKETYKTESDSLTKSRDNLKQAKEQLRKLKEAGLNTASFNFEMTAKKLEEDRNRMKKENEQIVNDEVEKMKIEAAHEKAVLEMTSSSGGLRLDEEAQLKQSIELATLKLEKSTITTQLDVLRKEKRLIEDHVNLLIEKHTKQTQIQQLQNLQTFRAYREVFEEFKVDLENRWRGLLDDAIQDAVFLNSRNSELMQKNEQLNLEVKQLKDALSLSGTPTSGKVST